jgi:hypothetical protein
MSHWALSIAGHVDTADQEAQLIEDLRGLVSKLPNVAGAFAHTENQGQVNLLTGEASGTHVELDTDLPTEPVGAADQETAGDTPDDAARS